MTVYNIYSKFSSNKMKKRTLLVGRGDDIERLYEEFPKMYLPEDLGGEIPEKNQLDWTRKLGKISKQVTLIHF